MLSKEFVPYEEALALKELGFDKECFMSYIHWLLKEPELRPVIDTYRLKAKECKAPLYQQAFRLFRKKYFIVGYVIPWNGKWTYKITSNKLKLEKNSFNTYEEAELACLRKLIEIVKEKKVN